MVTADDTPAPRRILLVSGLSGAGKSSILRILEDLEHEVIDNPHLECWMILWPVQNVLLPLG